MSLVILSAVVIILLAFFVWSVSYHYSYYQYPDEECRKELSYLNGITPVSPVLQQQWLEHWDDMDLSLCPKYHVNPSKFKAQYIHYMCQHGRSPVPVTSSQIQEVCNYF